MRAYYPRKYATSSARFVLGSFSVSASVRIGRTLSAFSLDFLNTLPRLYNSIVSLCSSLFHIYCGITAVAEARIAYDLPRVDERARDRHGRASDWRTKCKHACSAYVDADFPARLGNEASESQIRLPVHSRTPIGICRLNYIGNGNATPCRVFEYSCAADLRGPTCDFFRDRSLAEARHRSASLCRTD